MTTVMAGSSPKEDWIKIKNIVKKEDCYRNAEVNSANWAYNPSGTVCANLLHNSEVHPACSGQSLGVFLFIDMVNKVSYEMNMEHNSEENAWAHHFITKFYFTAEDELVVVTAYAGMRVEQFLYKVDYKDQKLKLLKKIRHEYIERSHRRNRFCFQSSKFVTCDGTDYILLVNATKKTYAYYPAVFCTIYMIPMDPSITNKPIKEFLLYLPEQVCTPFEEKIKTQMEAEGGNFSLYAFGLSSRSCMVRGTKLWLNYSFKGSLEYNYNGTMEEEETSGELIGEHYEVELTKLIDISKRTINSLEDRELLMKEQEGACQFIQRGATHIAITEKFMIFYHSQKDIGTLYMFHEYKKPIDGLTPTYETKALLFPWQMSPSCEPINLDIEGVSLIRGFPFPRPSDRLAKFDVLWTFQDRFALDPQGALLRLSFGCRGNVRIRIIKCFKMDLKSLALTKALIHKDTPIRNHPAYRLCFKGTKPIQYENSDAKIKLASSVIETDNISVCSLSVPTKHSFCCTS